MEQTAPAHPEKQATVAPWCRPALWAATAGMVFALFHLLGNTVANVHSRSVFAWMVARWDDRVSFGADYSIGWFIPLISGGLIWRRRRELTAAARDVCAPFLAPIVFALLLHWLGARVQQPRLSLTAFVLLVWAIPGYLLGRRWAGLLLFPCGYLLFCVPWNFLDSMTFPLRLLSSMLSAGLLNGLGLAVVRSGTVIRAARAGGFDFNVADACSGLSSMLAMAAITALYAHLTQRTFVRQATLFACAVPLAIVGNVFRIMTVALVARLFGHDLALKLYHDYSAFIIFPVAILLMLAAGRWIDRWGRRRSEPA